MALESESKNNQNYEEKEWGNPVEPFDTFDDRDKEQLVRQYKEAKRRKNNLTEEKTVISNNQKKLTL